MIHSVFGFPLPDGNKLYQNEKLLSTALALPEVADRPMRKASPPVPVVQRKLIESFLNGEIFTWFILSIYLCMYC